MKISVILLIFFIIKYCCITIISGQNTAEEKCLEYSKAVYQEQDEIFSLRSFVPKQNISTCSLYENPLIVGGTPARNKEFPHMAVIGFGPEEDADVDWLCGGSLISEKHVLTAAHCTVSQNGPPQKVRLGTVSLEINDDYVQEVGIENFLNHPKYKRPVKYHDIAILFLKNSVIFTAFVRPACLNTKKGLPYSKAVASGFGKVKHVSTVVSPILLKVDLDVIPNENCSKYLRFRKHEMPQNIVKEMLCAGYLKGGKDTCQGDSGGPLQVILDDPYCMYSIIGITSFGRFCGMAFSPGIYTKVDEYIQWIESIVWKK